MIRKASVNNSDDWDLLSEIAKKNHEAFRKLFCKYRKPVFSFIIKKISHNESAEDACQDVFLRLWEKANNFKKKSPNFSTLLFGIANKVVFEYWNSAKKEREKMKQIEQELEPLSNLINNTDQEKTEKQEEKIDLFHQIAIDELSNIGNWRKGQPQPNLAFHLAVYRRRQACDKPQQSNSKRKDINIKGSSVARRYLWLKLWASGEDFF